MTSHLVAVHAYIGVLEVCLSAAAKRDPQGLALHFYKNGEPNEDQQGLQAYVARYSRIIISKWLWYLYKFTKETYLQGYCLKIRNCHQICQIYKFSFLKAFENIWQKN